MRQPIGTVTSIEVPDNSLNEIDNSANFLGKSQKKALETKNIKLSDGKKERKSFRSGNEPAINEIWIFYKKNNDLTSREKLILHYSPLVKYVASRINSSMPSHVEVGDLISYGLFGLIDAIEKYDLLRNIKFETYAIMRIHGSIMDELRSYDWVPRSVRTQAKNIQKASTELEKKLHRSPTELELAEYLNVDEKTLNSMLHSVSLMSITPFDEVINPERGENTLGDSLQDENFLSPEREADLRETQAEIITAIKELPERERIIIALYYYERFTLSEIGTVLGVTEGRISQLHGKAILHLKERIADYHRV